MALGRYYSTDHLTAPRLSSVISPPRYHPNVLTDVPGLVLPPLFGTVKAVVKSFIGWTEGFFVFEVDDF